MRSMVSMLAGCLVLAGCQNGASVRDPAVGAYIRLDGAQLQLKLPLQVAAGEARVFIQDGRVSHAGTHGLGGRFDQYRPHCAFEIWGVDHEGVTIEPDTFRVLRVEDSLQQVVRAGPRRLAALDTAFGFGWHSSTSYHQGYHFVLHSERQPNVMRMSCYGVYAQPYELEPPTLPEIRAALGDLAEIHR